MAAAPARQDSHFPSAALGEPGRQGTSGLGGRAAAGLWRGGARLQGARTAHLVRDAGGTYRAGTPSAEDAPPPAWPSHRIDESLTVVHGLNVLDWDGDGRDEILTASFEGVHLFHSAGYGAELTWTRTHLGAGDQQSSPKRGASEIGVGKVAGKRFLATIEPWHGDQVVVYSEAPPGELWPRHVIDPNFHEGHALACADLDGDGNDEIVAGFRGPGTSLFVYYAADNSGLNWERQLLDAEMATSGLAIADINGDGRKDIVAIGSSTGNVKWYENLSG